MSTKVKAQGTPCRPGDDIAGLMPEHLHRRPSGQPETDVTDETDDTDETDGTDDTDRTDDTDKTDRTDDIDRTDGTDDIDETNEGCSPTCPLLKLIELSSDSKTAPVSNYVSTNKGTIGHLKKPAGAKLRIADVDETVYGQDEDQIYAWGNRFLRDPADMRVFAVVQDDPCLREQLVLMTCEDTKVYAYDGEMLRVVALSMDELRDMRRLKCPAYDDYYDGDAFNHMTEEDWAKEMQSPLGKKLDEEHRELVASLEPKRLEILRSTSTETGIVS